ncbi:PadR family transcriptional regulator [Sporolactobacillus pectinivorans]|uniref:PadR family transcriptional regulator n=1 Tax=Sporolactobacillus pectinivorans TaxID=1591408 RepID=UPI000C258807|nr:PadR family transcriptional regulator [Sporolactobacillus pectinivorans]
MDTQMKKGILEMCILFKLKDEPLYGYELMKSIRKIFPDVYEGSVYTILRRLKATGFTSVTQEKSPAGPTRKYYSITPSGLEYLKQSIEEWRTVVQGVVSLGIKI